MGLQQNADGQDDKDQQGEANKTYRPFPCIYAYMYNVHHMPPSIYIYIYVLTTHMYFDLHFSAPQQANIWAWHKSLGFCRASSRKLKTVNPDWIMQCMRRGM